MDTTLTAEDESGYITRIIWGACRAGHYVFEYWVKSACQVSPQGWDQRFTALHSSSSTHHFVS